MKAAKFKKGQIVRIKKIEDIHDKEIHPSFVVDMVICCDTEGKITSVNKHTLNYDERKQFWVYQIRGWTWREDWLCVPEFLTDNDFEI